MGATPKSASVVLPANKPVLTKYLRVTQAAIILLITLQGVAVAFLGFSFYFHSDLPQDYKHKEIIERTSLYQGIIGIVTTCIVCGGALWTKNNSGVLKIVYATVIILTAAEMLSFRGLTTVDDDMTKFFNKYHSSKQSQAIVDEIQTKYKCCGYTGIYSYPSFRRLPRTCCPLAEVKRTGSCLRTYAYQTTCKQKIEERMTTSVQWLDDLCFSTASSTFTLALLVLAKLSIENFNAITKKKQ